MDSYLSYLSVLALVASTDRKKLLMGYRYHEDKFFPDMPAWPGGRVQQNELALDRMVIESSEESGVLVAKEKAFFVGECYFPRDAYTVHQLCFAVPAENDEFLINTSELRNIGYLFPHQFFGLVPNEGYFANYHTFLNKAIDIGIIFQ